MFRFTLAALAAVLLTSTFAFVADHGARAAEATAARAAEETAARVAEDSELEVHMKAINKATRKLRGALKDDTRRDEALAIVLEIQSHALQAKGLDPEKLATLPDGDKPQFVVDYRKAMHGFLGTTFALELAVLEGRVDDAATELKQLIKGKSPAHKKFKLEGDDDHDDDK